MLLAALSAAKGISDAAGGGPSSAASTSTAGTKYGAVYNIGAPPMKTENIALIALALLAAALLLKKGR